MTTAAIVEKPREGRRVRMLGMAVDVLTELGAVALLRDRLERREGTWVITPNLDILRQFHRRTDLRTLFEGADVMLADGMPLIWASRVAGLNLPERVPGSGLAVTMAGEAARYGWRLFLLGGDPGAAEAAAQVLTSRHPELQIVGTACPAFGFERDEAAMKLLEVQLADARPDLVYVALGFPKQEFLIQRLRRVLPRATFMGVGISLSFIAGRVQRAPRWIQQVGLEWLHRLVQEPKRLAKRYLVHDLPFAMLVLFPRAAWARVSKKSRGRDWL